MPLAVDQPNLAQLFGGDNSILAGQLGLEQLNRANTNSDINQAGALQDMFQSAQTNPLKVRQMELGNQTTEAQLPGITAQSGMLQDKAQISRGSVDLQGKAARSKLIQDMSDDDVKGIENLAQMLAYSPDPEMRAKGEAMMKMHKDVLKEREKARYAMERQLELEAVKGKNALDVANVSGGYKVAVKNAGGGGAGKPVTMSQFEAALRQQVLEGDEEALVALQALEEDKRKKAAAGAQVGDQFKREFTQTPKAETPTDYGQGRKKAPGTQAELKAAVEAQGETFDTSKYDYRFNPETGRMQRKAKGQ